MLNKGHLANFAQNRLPWQRPLRNWKEVRIEKIHANTFHMVKTIVKIGPVDAEIYSIKKEISEGRLQPGRQLS